MGNSLLPITGLLTGLALSGLVVQQTHAQETPAFEWAKHLVGSPSFDFAESITTDATGNVYTTGLFSNTVDFDPGAPVFNLTSAGGGDIFISKVDANGSFMWAKSIGGVFTESTVSIATDALGNVYATGYFGGTMDFDPGPGVFNLTPLTALNEVFIVKIDANGDFVWAKSIGTTVGAGAESKAIDVDPAGFVYTTGYFAGTVDFNPGAGVSNLTSNGQQDVFISKLDVNGNFVWAQRLGGTSNDYSWSLTTDAAGNVYTLGSFQFTVDFDPGPGVSTLTSVVGFDIFISKLDTDGNFVWAKSIGNSGNTNGNEIAVDGSGNVYLTGDFDLTLDFDPGPGTFNLSAGTDRDAFICKLDAAGVFVWAKSVVPSLGFSTGNSITIDGANKVITAGYFSGTADFDPGTGSYSLVASNSAFYLKLDENGNLVWATLVGPIGVIAGSSTSLSSVTSDSFGNIYGTGGFDGTGDFDGGPCTNNFTGGGDIFILKINPAPVVPPPTIASFTPSSGPFGTPVTITGTNFSTTPANNTVTFNSTPAIVTASTATSITTTVPAGATIGQIAVTIACVTATSASSFTVTPPVQQLEWAKAHVGSLDTFSESMATDPSGNVYTTGTFTQTTDFDPGSGVFNLTSAGNFDVFISKLNTNGIFQWAIRIGGTGSEDGRAITTDAAGNVYVAGTFLGPVDFDPGAGTTTLPGPGNAGYVAKFDTNGNLVWAAQITSNIAGTWSLIVDSSNDLCIASAFTGTADFDPGAPVVNLTSAGSADIFIMKLSSAGNFVWARRMGSTLGDVANRITLDAGGNLLTTGYFNGTVDFDPGAGTSNLTSAGANDIFISKLNSSGNFVWARRVGSTGAFDIGHGIASDASSNVYTTGVFTGTVDFDPGGTVSNLTSAGGLDIFVLKLNASGNFLWARNMGGTADDFGISILVDASQNVLSSGFFRQAADFDPGAGTYTLSTANNSQVYVSALDGSGNFSWALSTNGGILAVAESPTIAFDPAGNLVLAGIFENGAVDFDPGSCVNSLSSTFIGTFIVKLSPTAISCGPTITSFTPSSGTIGTSVTITGTNFSATPVNNIVYFGATRANVSAATTTQLTVTVPTGATHQPISIQTNGLTGYSLKPFVVTFAGGGSFDNCSFEPKVNFETNDGLSSEAFFGDIDGDGKVDVITAKRNTNSISIYRNTSIPGQITSGSFAPKIDIITGTSGSATPGPVAISFGDIDGDGKPDIAAVNYRGGTLAVFRNLSTSGIISLSSRVEYAIGDFATGGSLMDIDGDGKLDAVVTSFSDGVSVLRNTATSGIIDAGSFASRLNFATGPNPFHPSIADFDSDGKLDIAVPNANNYTVSLLHNTSTNGTVSFAAQQVVTYAGGTPALGTGTFPLSAADLDGDGKIDLLVCNNTLSIAPIFRNTSIPGTITFAPQVNLTTSAPPAFASISDLDGDGKVDLAIFNGLNNPILIYKNSNVPGTISTPSFGSPIGYGADPLVGIFGSADIDGDGKNDIVNVAHGFYVLRNVIGEISPPTITSFTPSSGPAGTTVTITGTNFSTPFTNTVEFNGVPATITATTSTSLTVTVPAGATTGPIQVIVGCNTVNSSTNFSVCTTPSTPGSGPNSRCGSGTVILGATGTTDGNYRWYTVSSGGTAIAGEVNSSYTTPIITSTTTYYVSIDNGGCEGPRTPVTATINIIAKPDIATSNCTATGATLTGPTGFASYAWSDGSTTPSINVTLPGSYTLIVTSAAGCISPSSDPTAFTSAFCNQPPTISPATVTTTIQAVVTLSLNTLISDLDNNIDLASVNVAVPPTSGATATINAGLELEVDYSGVAFAGTDQLTIEACDLSGACTQQVIMIEVAGDITVYNALSPNGDGKNDVFYIQYINALPETQQNNVTILNRWGTVVFETTNYDNTSNVFKGLSNSGSELPSGTYYYTIEFTSGEAKRTGFISLRR